MTIPLSEALDEAQLVRSADYGPITRLAVWHGGHTVNSYDVRTDGDGVPAAVPASSVSVGDFRTGEVAEREVREAMDRMLGRGRQAELDETV